MRAADLHNRSALRLLPIPETGRIHTSECLRHARLPRPVRAERLWPTAAAVGKRQLLTVQPRLVGATESLTTADYLCRPCRGSSLVLPLLPMAAAMGHPASAGLPLRGLPPLALLPHGVLWPAE
jgi:hypothetical protein